MQGIPDYQGQCLSNQTYLLRAEKTKNNASSLVRNLNDSVTLTSEMSKNNNAETIISLNLQ